VGAGVGFERSFHIPMETDSPSTARADGRHYGTTSAMLHRDTVCVILHSSGGKLAKIWFTGISLFLGDLFQTSTLS
jgi:hypothetical protein